MTYKTRHGLRGMLAAGAMALAATIPLKAQAETTYNLALLSDFSGPYADIMPTLASSREAVFDWWNATSGQKLGVKLNYKNYETRYDAAQVASLWPGIKSELDPIAVVGLGGPDVAALSERLAGHGPSLFLFRPHQNCRCFGVCATRCRAVEWRVLQPLAPLRPLLHICTHL